MLSARVGSWTPNLLHLCQTMVTTSYWASSWSRSIYLGACAAAEWSNFMWLVRGSWPKSCCSSSSSRTRLTALWGLHVFYCSTCDADLQQTAQQRHKCFAFEPNCIQSRLKNKTYFKHFFISCWVLMLALFAPLTYLVIPDGLLVSPSCKSALLISRSSPGAGGGLCNNDLQLNPVMFKWDFLTVILIFEGE